VKEGKMSKKTVIPPLTDEVKANILQGRSEQQQLGLKSHWALTDLGKFFEKRGDPRYYAVNSISRQLELIWQVNDVSDRV
jgi:hypothetical protein